MMEPRRIWTSEGLLEIDSDPGPAAVPDLADRDPLEVGLAPDQRNPVLHASPDARVLHLHGAVQAADPHKGVLDTAPFISARASGPWTTIPCQSSHRGLWASLVKKTESPAAPSTTSLPFHQELEIEIVVAATGGDIRLEPDGHAGTECEGWRAFPPRCRPRRCRAPRLVPHHVPLEGPAYLGLRPGRSGKDHGQDGRPGSADLHQRQARLAG